jgi:hypothetical protein
VAALDFKPRFASLYNVEIWLPCPFAFRFESTDVAGNRVWFGSSHELLGDLRRLNEETFRATPEKLARWREEGVEAGDRYEKSARFGLAMFLALAELSVKHRLPMKLDY